MPSCDVLHQLISGPHQAGRRRVFESSVSGKSSEGSHRFVSLFSRSEESFHHPPFDKRYALKHYKKYEESYEVLKELYY